MKTTIHSHPERQARREAAEADPQPRRARPAAFVDNRPEAIAQRQLADAIDTSPYMVAQRQRLHGLFGESAPPRHQTQDAGMLQGQWASVQHHGPDEALGQGRCAPNHQQGHEAAQPLPDASAPVQRIKIKLNDGNSSPAYERTNAFFLHLPCQWYWTRLQRGVLWPRSPRRFRHPG